MVFARKNDLELVIFCGSPGAGKSTWFQHHLKPLGYERVNQDILKSVCCNPLCTLLCLQVDKNTERKVPQGGQGTA